MPEPSPEWVVTVNGNETHACTDCGVLPIVVLVGHDGPAKRRCVVELCGRCLWKRGAEAEACKAKLDAIKAVQR